MNGKFLMFFFIILNVITVIMMGAFGQDTGIYSGFTDSFFETTQNSDGEIYYTGNLSSGIDTELENLRDEEQGLFESLASSFFDVAKMLTGFIGLITPVPFIALINSLDLAWYITLIIALPLSILWIIALFEFMGNRTL